MSNHSSTPPDLVTVPLWSSTKLQALVRSRYAPGILAVISFIESMLPVPLLTDPFLLTAVLLNRARYRSLVFITMLGSVVGGSVAYMTATLFREVLLSSLTPELLVAVESFSVAEQGTFWLTIIGALTPVPYTIVAWAVALSNGSLLVFILASLFGRGLRYGIVGWCTYKFGPAALSYARRSLWLSSLVIFILVGIYVWLKL